MRGKSVSASAPERCTSTRENSKASLSIINMAAIKQNVIVLNVVPFAFNSLRCASNRRKFFTLSDTTTCGLVVALELELALVVVRRKENVNEENRSVSVDDASFRTRTRLLAQTSQPHKCCLRVELTGPPTGVRSKDLHHTSHINCKTATFPQIIITREERDAASHTRIKGVCALVDTGRTVSPTTGGLRRRSVPS